MNKKIKEIYGTKKDLYVKSVVKSFDVFQISECFYWYEESI